MTLISANFLHVYCIRPIFSYKILDARLFPIFMSVFTDLSHIPYNLFGGAIVKRVMAYCRERKKDYIMVDFNG